MGKKRTKTPGARWRPGIRKESTAALVFLAPSMALLSIFFLFPFVDTIRRSFFDARGAAFTGVDAYQSVFQNEAFQLAAQNTAKFIAVCVPALLLLSLALALMVRAIRPGGKRLKTAYLLPMAIPVASIVMVWRVLFSDDGLLNGFLGGIGAEPVSFLFSDATFWVLIFTYLWKNAGYDMVLWLAGLDGIPESLYEAAAVDGANAWQTFRHVTLPSLLPTTGLVGILSLMSSFKVFREAYLVSGAYPPDSIYMLQHLFNNWFTNLEINRLCAAAVLLTAVLVVIILLMQRFLRDKSED